MKSRVLISTGGSGGHVVPALTFYEHLIENYEVFISTDRRGIKFINNPKFKNIKIINVPSITNNIILFPWNIVLLILATLKSLIFLKNKKIKIIISTGGYMSLPICFAAKILKCKIILFEPNMVIGRANSFFLKSCSSILCYSNKIINFPKKFQSKIKKIPPLLRQKLYVENYSVERNFDDLVKILVIGGSQGADFFQNKLNNVILKLSYNYKIEIIHQSNKNNEKDLEDFYKKNNIKYNLFNFKNDISEFVKNSNLCITRSGATSLAELVHLNIPFIAIPFPHAKDNHQFYNAKFYTNLNCCWMIEQNSNISDDLYQLISNIISDKSDLKQKIDSMKKITYENSWNNINKKILGIIDEN